MSSDPFTGTVLVAVLVYTGVSLAIVCLIMIAKALLIPSGDVTITVNDQKKITAAPGGKLLGTLANEGIFVPAACGGGGTCAQCLCKVHSGGGSILPTEETYITRREARAGRRLACQVPVKHDMQVEVPPEVFETKKWECTVRSNKNVAAFIKELVLDLPEGEDVDFEAGGYIQIEVPPHEFAFTDFDIDEQFKTDWDRADLWKLTSRVPEPVTRAYSMANYPGEKGVILLTVRIAVPPASDPDAPPGIVSSYIFNLKPGDKVTISGPYGHFFINETDAEMVYIGRGAGMAPLRSHIFELLKGRNSTRKISYVYNARNLRETFYTEEFRDLERTHPNFGYYLVLSRPEEGWDGVKGYAHQALYDRYLKDHPAPEDIEYYLCGPPVMADAIVKMLDDLGVERENIFFDDFG